MQQMTFLLPFILMLVLIYFFTIRPQKKKQDEARKMLSEIKKGDRVVLYNGLVGKVVATKGSTVTIEAEPNKTKWTYKNIAIIEVLDKETEAEIEDMKNQEN